MARKIKWSLLSIALLLLGVTGYYTYAFVNFSNNIQSTPENSKFFNTISAQNITKTGESFTPPKWEGKQRVNVLLLGGDSRGLKKNEVPRSDTLIIASIDPITKKAYLFSILRDTYVKIPGSGEDRINAALALGGPNLAMKTVGDLLGMPIEYYVYTDFKGFIALIDAIDGIDINVEKDMKYSDSEDGHEYDINLKKGMQHLDGKMALQYVRFRHDALSDFARTERQRNFMQAVAQKMQSTSSIIKLPKILSSVDPYIETNLTTTDMLKLGALGFEAKTEGMVSQQIPPSELLVEKRVGGAEVLSVDRNKLHLYIQALFDGKDPVEAGKTPYVKESVKSSSSTTVNTSSKSSSSNSASSSVNKSSGTGTTSSSGVKTNSPAPASGVKQEGTSSVPATGQKPANAAVEGKTGTSSAPAAGGKASGSGSGTAPTANSKQSGSSSNDSAEESKLNGSSKKAPAADANQSGSPSNPAANTKQDGSSSKSSADENKTGSSSVTAPGTGSSSVTAPGTGSKSGTKTGETNSTSVSEPPPVPLTGNKSESPGAVPGSEAKSGTSTTPAAGTKNSGTSGSTTQSSGQLPAAD